MTYRKGGSPLVYGGDLETDHNEEKAWVVQWAISDGEKEVVGRTLEELEKHLKVMLEGAPSIIYFHNLRYDLAFLKYALYNIIQEIPELTLVPIIRERSPISINLQADKDSGLFDMSFRDSSKKIPGKLASLAKSIGMKKLEGFNFEPGWSRDIDFNNRQNWEYVKNDARIVAVAMQQLHADGNTKSTFSGDAWRNARIIINGSKYKADNDKWNGIFPKLSYEVDRALREAYFGGLNISNYHGENIGKFTHADVNSMYPSVMYYDMLPIGEPIYSNIEPKGELFVMKAKFRLSLKKGKIPWFAFKHAGDYLFEGLMPNTPVVKTNLYHELTLTSVDISTLKRWYDVEIDTSNAEYWGFKSNVGLFRPYIDKYLKLKRSEGEAGRKGLLMYNWAKFMLNSLYGRFGLNPNSEDNELVLDENGDLAWKPVPTIIDPDGYLPYAMFITAHARRRLLEYVEKCGSENVIHCDTDSVIHFGGRVNGVEYGNDLGQWGIESEPIKIWEGGFKRYIEQLKTEIDSTRSLKITCAGVPNNKTDSGVPIGMWVELWDDPEIICTSEVLGKPNYCIQSEWLRELYKQNGMDPDNVNTMKLIPKTVPGGMILTERQHKLDDCMRSGYRK